jgi:hypothetical protein
MSLRFGGGGSGAPPPPGGSQAIPLKNIGPTDYTLLPGDQYYRLQCYPGPFNIIIPLNLGFDVGGWCEICALGGQITIVPASGVSMFSGPPGINAGPSHLPGYGSTGGLLMMGTNSFNLSGAIS